MTAPITPHQTLMSSLDQFTRELDKSPLTIQAYRADIQQFIHWIAENDFTVTGAHQVERGHITEYLKYLANNKGHTGATRARKLVSLQVFFSYLVKVGVIPHSPATTIDRPRKEQKTMHYLRPDEYSRVLAEAAGDPRDYCIFQVFLHTGIRVSELVALLLSDLDLEQKTVIIHGKGNRERVIPLEKKPFQALKLYLDHRPKNTDPHVFLNYKGEGLSIRGVRKIVDKYVKQAGITKIISCHGLRRTCLSSRAARNMNAFAIQKLAGHARMETTRIYVQLSTEDLRRAMETANI